MPWCVRCGTSLSQHELTDSYAELTHTAVYLTLPFKDRPDERALVWTTTPWTLSAHVALAVHPALDYVKVRVKVRHQDQILYLARDAAARLGLQDRVLARLKGAELLNRPYHGPFDELPVQQGVDHRVIPWDEVNATEGSGIVHIAPGCGAEDYQLGQRYGLPALTPLDDNGLYTAGYGPFTGRSVFSVAPLVFEQLEQAGCLFALEEYTHRYPRCWRCKEELVYRLVGEWFIAIDEIRPRMLNAARQIEWLPPHAGKRMEDWLHNMGDWCISRKRYWGLPLPFYQSEDGQLLVVRDKDQLRQLATDPKAVDALPELHRPWIDQIHPAPARRPANPPRARGGRLLARRRHRAFFYPSVWARRQPPMGPLVPGGLGRGNTGTNPPMVLLDALYGGHLGRQSTLPPGHGLRQNARRKWPAHA